MDVWHGRLSFETRTLSAEEKRITGPYLNKRAHKIFLVIVSLHEENSWASKAFSDVSWYIPMYVVNLETF